MTDQYIGPNNTRYTLVATYENVVFLNEIGYYHVVSWDDFDNKYRLVEG